MFESEEMVEENTNYGQHMQGMIPFPHVNKMQVYKHSASCFNFLNFPNEKNLKDVLPFVLCSMQFGLKLQQIFNIKTIAREKHKIFFNFFVL
jgi:hypothetical protein